MSQEWMWQLSALPTKRPTDAPSQYLPGAFALPGSAGSAVAGLR